MAKYQMQGLRTSDSVLIAWRSVSADWAGADAGVGVTDVVVASAPGASSSPAIISCAITSPSPGATVSQGVPVTITGTISVAGSVVVKLGATVLGSATVVGLNWSYAWTPMVPDIGAQTLNATATATVGGATGNASGTAITVAYNFATDARLMARYRAADGLNDLSGAGLLGPLVATGGAISASTDADGNAVWQLRSGGGGYLKTTAGATVFYNPITVVLIAKAGPSPAGNQCWATTFGVASSIFWSSSASLKLTGASSINIACTPANENVFMIYEHNNTSSASVNGAAFAAVTGTGGNVGVINTNLCLGAGDPSGGNRADVDIAEMLVFEGPLTDQFLAGFVPYLRTRYPSRSVSVTPPAAPSPHQTARGALPGGAFDFIVLAGQSNNDGLHSLSGSPTAAGAKAFVFASDNTIKAMPALYGDPTGTIDSCDINALAGVGGNGTALAAAYTAATGRNLVVVPCAVGGTQLLASWGTSLVRGNKQRNCLYGRMLDRIRNMIEMGGTFRGLIWYQGESEAQAGGAVLASYQSDLNNFLTTLFTDLGISQKVIIQTLANTVAGASGPNLAAMQAAQAANAVAGQRLIGVASSGPYEADNLHLAIAAQNALGAAWSAQIVSAGW